MLTRKAISASATSRVKPRTCARIKCSCADIEDYQRRPEQARHVNPDDYPQVLLLDHEFQPDISGDSKGKFADPALRTSAGVGRRS